MIYALIILSVSAGLFFKLFWNERKKRKAEEVKNKNLKKNIEVLKDHHSAVKDIKENYKDTVKQIKGAKSNEEVENVISDIIALNNNRVYDNPDKR